MSISKFPFPFEEMKLEILEGAEVKQDKYEYPNQQNSEKS